MKRDPRHGCGGITRSITACAPQLSISSQRRWISNESLKINRLARYLEKPMAEFALTLLSFLVFGVAVLLLLGWTLQ
jgi:hypothetical protein